MTHRIRQLFITLILCLTFPLTVYAETYSMSDTDMSIRIDDTSWYVFTRDNIEGNSELDELGITHDFMESVFYDNMAHMDAFRFDEDGDFLELFIRKQRLENTFTNLANYDDELLYELAEAFAERQNAENYSIYGNQYRFVKLEYFDSAYEMYICEFITIVNKDNYTLTFQSPSPIDGAKLSEIQKIVDSVSFDVDYSMEEPILSYLEEPQKTSISNGAMEILITSTISGGLLGLFTWLCGRMKKARKAKKEVAVSEQENSPNIEQDNQAVPEKLECQPEAINTDETPHIQDSTSAKDVDSDRRFDEIKKYKELLDLGIITKEEFDSKKRELLGL